VLVRILAQHETAYAESRVFQRELLDTARDVVRASERMDVLKKYVYYGQVTLSSSFSGYPMTEYSPKLGIAS
jgi:hypothetical protein